MSRIRQSIVCPYCKSIINLPKAGQFYCSIKCRFWDKAEILGPDECWNWKAAKLQDGYGRFGYQGSHSLAHRFAWFLTHGPIPNNRCILHKCDNPACVNPSHLFLGTMLDNSIDMFQKNRQRHLKGEYNPVAKLTNEQVKEIKIQLVKGCKQSLLAKKYGVAYPTISHINSGFTWSHVISPMLQYNLFS